MRINKADRERKWKQNGKENELEKGYEELPRLPLEQWVSFKWQNDTKIRQ